MVSFPHDCVDMNDDIGGGNGVGCESDNIRRMCIRIYFSLIRMCVVVCLFVRLCACFHIERFMGRFNTTHIYLKLYSEHNGKKITKQ